MTAQVCLLGNSHVAALREASIATPERWGRISFTAIGGHEETLLETRCADGVLTPVSDAAKASLKTFGGVETLDLNGFDAVVIVGCQMACARAGALYRRARWTGLPSLSKLSASEVANAPWQLMSRPSFAATLADILRATLGWKLLEHLRPGTQTRLMLASQPRMTTHIQDLRDHALSINNHVMRSGDGQALSEIYEDVAQGTLSEAGVTYLPQPAHTIKDHLMTKPQFTNGAVRLSASERRPQPPKDLLHANAAYGQLVLDQIAQALGQS